MCEMAREEILAMEPGRELDALVAEKVIGIRPNEKYGWFGWHPRANAECDEWQEIEGVRRYSNDIAAAWEVVEKMREKGMYLCLMGEHPYYETGFKHSCKRVSPCNRVTARNAPEAICKAALLAVMCDE